MRATAVWYGMSALSAFLHGGVFSITAIYFVEDVGMDPLQLVLVGTAMELAAFLFEVPTGVVADVYSRKRSIVIGFLVHGAAMAWIGAVPSFPSIVAAYFVFGLGWTFFSGALDAWLADEIGLERLGPVYFRTQQLRQAATLAGIGAGVALARIDLQLPIVLGGIGMLGLGLAVWGGMPETGFRPVPTGQREGYRAMVGTLASGLRQVRGHPVLLLLLAVAGLTGMYSEGIDRLSEAHLLKGFRFPAWGGLEPVVWLGGIRAGGLVLGILGTEWLRRRVDAGSTRDASRWLFGITGVQIAGALGFALAGHFGVAVAWAWLGGVARTASEPIFSTWLNRSVASDARATVLSMSAQMDALGQIAGGPAVGGIGRALSIRAALCASAAVLSPALWLFVRAGRRGIE